jgi:ubiquitin-protein ligase
MPAELTKVRIFTQGGDEHDIETPLDIRVTEFIDELALALNLPKTDAESRPVSWRMDNKDTGRTLEGERTLEENGVRHNHRLSLLRQVVAGAPAKAFDPRQERLKTERQRLEKLNQESDHVRVEPLNVLPGSEPEHYRITFLCRGIIGIDSNQGPLYGNHHQVEIHCDEAFPSDVPRLRWLTDVWHPNVQHTEPKGVCVNKAEWLGGMGLDDLCRQLFEMVQYKNYHAEHTPPYPLDQAVARWVREVAEPRGLVNKRQGKFIDDKPFTRPTLPRKIAVVPAPPAAPVRVRVMPKPAPLPGAPGPVRRIRIGKRQG